jgi:hypothetical protein
MYIAPTKHIVNVKQYHSADFYLSEDGKWLCAHTDAYIEPACCSGYDSEGNPSCACHGMDGVICPAIDCTGIEDWQIEELFDRLQPEMDYDNEE